jgi:zinc transport system substrate-binding protein
MIVMTAPRSTTFRVVTLALAAAPILAGCGAVAGSDSGEPQVVASFYPLEFVAERIVGEHAEVSGLTSPGVEPHDLELSVAQTADVADADLAFYLEGFQPAVDDTIEQNGPEHVVEAAAVVTLAPAGDHTGESEEEHADHGDLDPHFWLDPRRLDAAAEAFYQQMSRLDPENQDAYRAGYADLSAELNQLDRAYRQGLANCEINTVVVSHDAFGYLEEYGLHFESVSGLSPEAEPSPAHIAQLHDLIESHGITTVFSETLASKQMSESIAGDLGIDTAVLDPIEGLSDATAGEDYFSLMRANLAALQEANRCQ